MRIGVDARVFSLPELRGIGSYLTELLAAWPVASDTFVLMSPGPIPGVRLQSPASLETVVVPHPRGYRFRVWDWWSLPRAVGRIRADLLWSPANQAVPLAGLPQVVTIHDTLLQERVLHDALLDRLFHGSVSPFWVRRYATRVITVSRFSLDRIQTVYSLASGVGRVIYNGATLAPRPFQDKSLARMHLREKGLVPGPFVLALGAESSWKNTEGAIRAFALVAREVPDVAFVLAGVQDGARERFDALRRELGLGQRLRILAFVDQEDRDALYQGAEVFVYPSLFEGFGLPPLEAMALGTPVVASRAASIPEVVGQAGLLVDATDPAELSRGVLRVLQSTELAQTLVAAGLENIRRFRWSDAAEAHRELFLESLAS